jgi:hypothetical protein
MNLGSGEQLVALEQSRWLVTLLIFGVLAPCLSLLVWPGMYPVLKPARAAALYGVLVSCFGFMAGMVAEVIRLSVIMSLPSAYVAATDAARPAILAVGAVLQNVFHLLQFTSFLAIFAVGMPLIALAIFRAGTLPRWLGWVLLAPSILVGYIGGPLVMLGHQVGGPFIGLGLNVFFVWFVIVAVMLLRWQPSRDGTQAVATS